MRFKNFWIGPLSTKLPADNQYPWMDCFWTDGKPSVYFLQWRIMDLSVSVLCFFSLKRTIISAGTILMIEWYAVVNETVFSEGLGPVQSLLLWQIIRIRWAFYHPSALYCFCMFYCMLIIFIVKGKLGVSFDSFAAVWTCEQKSYNTMPC